MICLSWNCRGLGNPRAIPVLQEIVKSRRPRIVFLSETISTDSRIEELRVQLGFEAAFAVDRTGRSGGLAVLWKFAQECTILSFSRNHIDLEVKENSVGTWRVTGFYGLPNRSRRQASWNLIRSLSHAAVLPWCIIGDFNDIREDEDKNGRTPHPMHLMNGFRQTISDCGLHDLPLIGHKFTWERGRGTDKWVENRALATNSWLQNFPKARLYNLVAPISDHSLILLDTEVIEGWKKRWQFRFENAWLKEPDFQEVVQSGLRLNLQLDILQRLDNYSTVLEKWGRYNANKFKQQIDTLMAEINDLRGRGNTRDLVRFKAKKADLGNVLLAEESYWKQRAKNFWLEGGDANTKFFHAAASDRRRRNRITRLQDVNGQWHEDSEGMCTVIQQYFQQLYEEPSICINDMLDSVSIKVTSEDNDRLLAPFTKEEFQAALFHDASG